MGVVPIPEQLVDDPSTFKGQLSHSLEAWETEGYKVVWLEVPIGKAALIPVAVDRGFSPTNTISRPCLR